MMELIQSSWGTVAAFLAVALLVFLAVRRMVLDKKAGIGACGQKCATCAKNTAHSAENGAENGATKSRPSGCGASCGGCPHAGACGKQ